jgi:2-dehydro-3-deoxygluconokinase
MSGFDVVCVGESMALVTPDPPAPLSLGGPMRLDAAGAESTVACYLAMLGVRSAWASRVGDDPLGVFLRTRVASYGVDTSLVTVDGSAPTGVFFKDPGERTAVYYYRTGSAAARLGPDLLPALSGVVHLSGITPALSSSCADLVEQALASPLTVSFDVNYRPGLWPVAAAAPVLHRLAGRADVVFVGLDEARTLWDVATPGDVRALLPTPGVLVVKDGAVGAHSFGPAGETFAAAPAVDVVEPVGAGDAYAAGYLYGLLHDLPEPDRLRLGHLVAGAALRVTGDVGDLPPGLLASLVSF